jgi:sigma-E factor negative regulatory protein RseB
VAIIAGIGVTGVRVRNAEGTEPGPSVQDPLATAREAVTKATFTGTVRVRWFDGKHQHTERVEVDDDNGLLVVGSSRSVITDGEEGLVHASDGWLALGADSSTQLGPLATANYRFSTLPDEVVAGRTTQVVEAVQLRGPLRERFFLDRATGVLLRREQIERGRTVHTVEFVTISGLAPAAKSPPTPPRAQHRVARVSTAELGRGRRPPRVVGNGFELVDAHRRPDGTLQLYYSDGLHGMSVFEQRGKLKHDALPEGGHDATLSGRRVRVYEGAAGRTFVWDTGNAVYACVTDAPLGAVGALLTKLPAHPTRGAMRSVMHFVLAPFSWE